MANVRSSKTWSRLLRIVVPGLAVALLAGCATGYAYVQPQARGSGSYYTSEGPYTGRGYYDYYGTGPYYPGTAGFGYYSGTWPYANPFGWYGGYGYGSSIGFSIGYSSGWNFPGYWGSWYGSYLPTGWNYCYYHRCRRYHHDSKRPDRQPTDLGVVSVRPTLPSQRTVPRYRREAVQAYRVPVRQADFAHERYQRNPMQPAYQPRPRRDAMPRAVRVQRFTAQPATRTVSPPARARPAPRTTRQAPARRPAPAPAPTPRSRGPNDPRSKIHRQ